MDNHEMEPKQFHIFQLFPMVVSANVALKQWDTFDTAVWYIPFPLGFEETEKTF